MTGTEMVHADVQDSAVEDVMSKAFGSAGVYKSAPPQPQAVVSRPPTYDQHARELYALPAEWEAFSWHAKGNPRSGFIELEGGVFKHIKTRGPYKGEKDYRKPEPGTQATVSLPMRLHNEWLARWERETGYCAECKGTGERNKGWDHIKGLRFEPCKKCGATGLKRPDDRTNGPADATGE